ncbi:MAG TPA: hypothetical protein VJ123_04055 [Anaerolineales bacterium]|nr:hypothetical protein [Anaerolineales bacterium]
MDISQMKKKLLYLGGLALLLVGCEPLLSTTLPPAFTTTPVASQTSPIATTVPTSSATIVLATQISTPTSMPVPTLTPQEREVYVSELLKTNADCQLPCWWGIIPSKTTWAETEQFIRSIGARTSVFSKSNGFVAHGTGGFDFNERSIYNRVSFFEREGVIAYITIDADGLSNPMDFKTAWEYYAPEQVVSGYGQPSRVWVQTISTAHEGSLGTSVPYDLWLFYDDVGFLIRYSGSVKYEPIYRMCPTFSQDGNIGDGIEMYLQSSESQMSLDVLVGEKIGAESSIHSIDEAAGMSVKEFHALFGQSEKPVCFETPRDIWP